MPDIYEPDNAWSVVIPASDLPKLKQPLPENRPWLKRSIERLWIPDEIQNDFEAIRGLPPWHCYAYVDILANIGVRASYHRWNYVPKGVVRAPHRQRGIIGDHHAFWIEEGYVVKWGAEFREGREIGWSMQSMINHEHPVNTERLKELPIIYDYAKTLKEDLERWFPDRRFIIGAEPGCSVSFYEPSDDAPMESDSEWDSHIGVWEGDKQLVLDVLLGTWRNDGPTVTIIDETLPTCNECGGLKVVQPYESNRFPGVIEAYCDKCGTGYIAASRYIRIKVGNWPET